MNEVEIREKLERAEKATKGPWVKELTTPLWGIPFWEIAPLGRDGYPYWNEEICATVGMERQEQDEANADFITHAREDVPTLARDLLAARERIERLGGVVEVARYIAEWEEPNDVAEDWGMYGATCGNCGHHLTIVRPGKYQCDYCPAFEELKAALAELDREAQP